MHPILFEFDTPQFLRFLLPDTIVIYSYGFLIALGALLGYFYTAYEAKKQFDFPYHKTQQLILWIIIAAVVGGKFFIFFEDPGYYAANPSALLQNFGNGFVFYGSLLFAIPTMLLFFQINKLPLLPMLDIAAILACITHGLGRLGCFMAGCCYGVPTNGPVAVTFTDLKAHAEPLNTPLHPTQLYASIYIAMIAVVLLIIKRHQKFQGQLFMLYLMMYSIGRSVIEIYRGDISRGYVIGDIVTNSQFFSAVVFIAALVIYLKLKRSAKYQIRPGS